MISFKPAQQREVNQDVTHAIADTSDCEPFDSQMAKQVDHQEQHYCPATEADEGDGPEEAKRLHCVDSRDADSHERRAQYDQWENSGGAPGHRRACPDLDDAISNKKQDGCSANNQCCVADKCLEDRPLEYERRTCVSVAGKIRKQEIKTGGSDSKDGLSELDA